MACHAPQITARPCIDFGNSIFQGYHALHQANNYEGIKQWGMEIHPMSQERRHCGGKQGRASVTGSPDSCGIHSLIGAIDTSRPFQYFAVGQKGRLLFLFPRAIEPGFEGPHHSPCLLTEFGLRFSWSAFFQRWREVVVVSQQALHQTRAASPIVN